MLKNKHVQGFTCLILLLTSINWSVLAEPLQEHKVKAALTINLIRFTDWPETETNEITSQINLCVIANHAMQQAFLTYKNKTIRQKQLNVDVIRRLNRLDHCHVLYINNLPKNKTIQLLDQFKQRSVLTIGEENFFTEYGGIVNLHMLQTKMEMRINIKAADKARLSISARVLKLATIVEKSN